MTVDQTLSSASRSGVTVAVCDAMLGANRSSNTRHPVERQRVLAAAPLSARRSCVRHLQHHAVQGVAQAGDVAGLDDHRGVADGLARSRRSSW